VFEGHVHPFQHPFLDLTEVAFWGSQEAENDLVGPGDSLKYRSPELA
jgi:hypothetical protein